jgi:hypothetical protein
VREQNQTTMRIAAIITNENLVYWLRCVLLDILEPLLDVLEGLLICDVIHQKDSHGISIVSGRDCLEPFLTRCIQQLQLDFLVVKFNSPQLEIYSDRWCTIHVCSKHSMVRYSRSQPLPTNAAAHQTNHPRIAEAESFSPHLSYNPKPLSGPSPLRTQQDHNKIVCCIWHRTTFTVSND